MKKIFMLLISAMVACVAAGEQYIDIFSGVTTEFPFHGAWELLDKQSKRLAAGAGRVILNLPDLPPESCVEAELKVDRKIRVKVRIWAQRMLDGANCTFYEQGNYLQSKLKKYFNDFSLVKKDDSAAKVIFSDKFMEQPGKTVICILPAKAFPLHLAVDGSSELKLKIISESELIPETAEAMKKNPVHSGLGVISDKKENLVDLKGKASFIAYERNGAKVVIVSPYVNWDEISVLLWLQNIVKNSI